MNVRCAPLAVLLLLASGASGAGLVRFKDWNKSPEFTFLATDAEQKEWKKVNEFKAVFDQHPGTSIGESIVTSRTKPPSFPTGLP